MAAARKNQDEVARIKSEAALEFETKMIEMRNKFEAGANDLRAGIKAELEREYVSEIARLRSAAAQAEDDKARLQSETKRAQEEVRGFDERLARVQKEAEDSKAAAAGNYERLAAQYNSLTEQKGGYERRLAAMESERGRFEGDIARLGRELEAAAASRASRENEFAALAANLKAESEKRSGLEAETLSLKKKVAECELQIRDAAGQLEAERQSFAADRDEAARRSQADQARLSSLSAELESYKQMDFSSRMKWALKGRQE
jgi:chromosome segregation ATPase